MHSIPFEIAPPKGEADFERMCAQIYGVVFNDRMPKMNGRRGQAQGGVDVFVKEFGLGRIGVQCKKYTLRPIKWKDVTDEVEKADKKGIAIKKLILATTASSDAVLLNQVQELSDERESVGKFSVEVEFWDDICNHIDRYPVLQDSYSPQSPGAAYYRQEAQLNALQEVAVTTRDALLSFAAMPVARADSADRLITAQLDHTNELIRAGRYRDALDHLAVIGKDTQPFDAHQKARWHLQRGLCLWFSHADDNESAEHFLKSFELYPDDDRMAAARIRGLILQNKVDEAFEASQSAIERFPASQQVWFITANVRLLKGERIQMFDVPEDLKTEPDTFQFVALAELKAGNFEEAIRLSQLAASDASAGFFIRSTALRVAAECGSRFPIGAMHGSLPPREVNALQFAIKQFEPWRERLWLVQSDLVTEAAVNLGYAFLMLQRFGEAISLARAAEFNGHHSPELLRVLVVALSELGREEELFELAHARLSEMNLAGLEVIAQIAAQKGKIALLEKIVEAASATNPVHVEETEFIRALRWEALERAGQSEAAVSAVLSANVDSTGGLISACVAARILHRAGRALEAESLIEWAKARVNVHSPAGDKLMLAELLFGVEQWAEAGTWFEELLPPGGLSELHCRLLACQVRSHNRKRARALIGRLPVGWTYNDEMRRLAIELGQQVGDWEFLKPLMTTQVRKQPDKAGSWLFKLSVSMHSSSPAEFQNDLREIPEVLHGPVRACAQLATLELRYGEAERGMQRLYRMVRCNLDEPEALSAYFIAMVAGPQNLPLMGDTLTTVVPGTAVTLQDEFGHSVEVVIDPVDKGEFPKREGYFSHTAPQAIAMIGFGKGQVVELPMAFGESKKYIVLAVQSAYRRMLQVIQERANAVGGLPNMKAVPMGATGDSERDLAYLKAEVSQIGRAHV